MVALELGVVVDKLRQNNHTIPPCKRYSRDHVVSVVEMIEYNPTPALGNMDVMFRTSKKQNKNIKC